MAKFDLKFLDSDNETDFIQCRAISTETELINNILIIGESGNEEFVLWLDKSTAIKFAKTLRTEINKIQDA